MSRFFEKQHVFLKTPAEIISDMVQKEVASAAY
jgi:hypothetical protein